jgi:hypothetical protein
VVDCCKTVTKWKWRKGAFWRGSNLGPLFIYQTNLWIIFVLLMRFGKTEINNIKQ